MHPAGQGVVSVTVAQGVAEHDWHWVGQSVVAVAVTQTSGHTPHSVGHDAGDDVHWDGQVAAVHLGMPAQ